MSPTLPSLGGMSTFNISHGYIESLLRGYRLTFLKDSDYHHLTQCDNMDDFKLNLTETDYNPFLVNLTGGGVSPSGLREICVKKYSDEVKYLQTQSVQPLTQFIEFITYEYMIENVMLLLKGTISGRNINELIKQCHPLGMFSESTMRSIPTFENNARGYKDLYQTVLIDTPVGKYFSMVLSDSGSNGGMGGSSDVKNYLEEVEIEVIKSSLLKYWLEDFYEFCGTLGGDTSVIMCDLLATRADTMAINITLNSFGTKLNEDSKRGSERRKLYPSFGYLYPLGTAKLSLVSDEDGLSQALSQFPSYAKTWSYLQATPDKSIDDVFYERDVRMLELAFEGQMHFGSFYAYVKLKEQETRNLVWIAECVLQGMKGDVERYVKVFSMSSSWRSKKN